MSKKQRLRVCLNLLQLEETAESEEMRRVYRQQYELLKHKAKKGE